MKNKLRFNSKGFFGPSTGRLDVENTQLCNHRTLRRSGTVRSTFIVAIREDNANVSYHISNEWNNAVKQCCVSDIVFSLTKRLNNVAFLHAK